MRKHIFLGNGHKFIHKHYLQEALREGHNLGHLFKTLSHHMNGLQIGDGVKKNDGATGNGAHTKLSKLKYKF